jgi:RNA-splicing ligase RtcB
MSENTITINGESTTAEIKTTNVDDYCLEQVETLTDSEAFQNPIKIMPDAHAGAGAVIGFTMEMGDRVCPNTVGVDIGCGMTAMFFDRPEEFNPPDADDAIRAAIPLGYHVYGDDGYPEQEYHMGQDFPWGACASKLEQYDNCLNAEYGIDYLKDVCERVGADTTRVINSLGTLGGGNHFIEIAESEDGDHLACVVHSGSRGIGLQIAEYWQERATEHINECTVWENATDELRPYMDDDGMPNYEAIKEDYSAEAIGEMGDRIKALHPPDDRNTDLDYLEGDLVNGYLQDMVFAQTYAAENRRQMLRRIADALGIEPTNWINSTHNYIDFSDNVIRKGATRVHEGEIAIIPFNMAEGSVVVRGRGNDDWNRSAPHGAGRRGSRTWAYDEFDLSEFKSRMQGVYSTSVSEDTLDEAPMAYKDTESILGPLTETAEVIDFLNPVLNIKAE